MWRTLRLALTLLVLGPGCTHPMQKALEGGDYLGACRAYRADEKAYRIDRSITRRMDLWLREEVDLRLRVEPVSADSLREGLDLADQIVLDDSPTVYRVTWTAAHLPQGSRVEISPPVVWERDDATILRPRLASDSPLTPDGLAIYLAKEPELALEPIPPEFLPREYVKEAAPGRLVYQDAVDPAKLALGLVTGGVTWLLDGGFTRKEPDVVPERRPKALAAHEKAQAKKKEAFDAAQRALIEQRRGQIEAITARNREKVAAHERLLAARRAFLEKWVRAVAGNTCRLAGEDGAVALGPGESCSYLNWGDYKSKHFLKDRFGVQTQVWVQLSADAEPCSWGLEDFLEVPRTPASPPGPWTNTLHQHFQAGERRLKLDVEPP